MGRSHLLLAIATLMGLTASAGCSGCRPADASSANNTNSNNRPDADEADAAGFRDIPADHYVSSEVLQSMLYFNNNVQQNTERGLLSSETTALFPPQSFPIRINQLCVLPGHEQASSLSAQDVGYLRGNTCSSFEDQARLNAFPEVFESTLSFFEDIDQYVISALHYFNGLYAYSATRPYYNNMRRVLRESMESARGRSFDSRRQAALWMLDENAHILALDDPELYNLTQARCGYSGDVQNGLSRQRIRNIVLQAIEVNSQEPVGTLVFSLALMLPALNAINEQISNLDPSQIRRNNDQIEVYNNGSWQTSSEFYASNINSLEELRQLHEFRGLIRANLALSMGAEIIDDRFGGNIVSEINNQTIGNNDLQSSWCSNLSPQAEEDAWAKYREIIQVITRYNSESYSAGRHPITNDEITEELQDVSLNDNIYGFLQTHCLETALNLFVDTENHIESRLVDRLGEQAPQNAD